MWKRIVSFVAGEWATIRVVATFVGIIFAFFMATDYAPIADRFNLAGWLARGAAVLSGFLLTGLGHWVGFTVDMTVRALVRVRSLSMSRKPVRERCRQRFIWRP